MNEPNLPPRIDLVHEAANRRYATKAFDPARGLSAAEIATLKSVLRLSPSSINGQPWHFVCATTPEGKEKVAEGMPGERFAYNAAKVRDAAMTVVLAYPADYGQANMDAVLAKEKTDGRYKDAKFYADAVALRTGFLQGKQQGQSAAAAKASLAAWMARQGYIALGSVLFAAGVMNIDACPIEGFDADAMGAALGFAEQGLIANVVVAFGHSDPARDFNAALPKSRLADVFTDI